MDVLLTQKQVLEWMNISRLTLLRWEEKELVHPIRLESGHRRYRKSEIEQLLGLEITNTDNVNCVIYSRVSTKKQQNTGNLERQTNRLKAYAENKDYNVIEVYEEVASGINENRRQLNRLMKKVAKEDVHIVLAEYKDRMARFGYNYMERYCNSHKTKIELMEKKEDQSLNEEMTEDMISIITSFSARLYGQRGARKIKYQIEKLNNDK